MTVEESVIYLASCAVNGEIPNKDKVSGIDQTEALSFAEKHMIGCCVAMALESAGINCVSEEYNYYKRNGLYIENDSDEVIVEVPAEDAKKHLETIESIMGSPIPWAEGLYLTADGFTCDYYRKD